MSVLEGAKWVVTRFLAGRGADFTQKPHPECLAGRTKDTFYKAGPRMPVERNETESRGCPMGTNRRISGLNLLGSVL